MSNSFADLLKNRKKQNEKLKEKIQKASGEKKEVDDRFFDLKTIKDENGHGKVLIRFLPPPPGEDCEFVTYFSYTDQNKENGVWYWHNSHKSFDPDAEDPAWDYNGKIWSSPDLTKEEKKIKSIRRTKNFVSNILIVKDWENPENDGKVFLYRYGPMIFKMIEERQNPTSSSDFDEAANPFDPIEGCNFLLKITPKQVGMDTMSTYEKSVWKDPSPMADDEEEMEKIWKQCYSLTEFIDPENTDMYKTLAKQKADLARYLGEDEEEDDDNVKPAKEEKSKSFAKELDDDIPFKEPKSSKDDEEEEDDLPFTVDDSDEDDDDDSFFDKFKE